LSTKAGEGMGITTPEQRLTYLCREKSNLTAEDIVILNGLLANLQYFADLAGADVFIDVLTKDSEAAVVVAEAKPATAPSLYKGSVVGEYAYRHNEPAVFQTFASGVPTINVQGISQEGVPICQTVIPINNSTNYLVAVLIMERDNSFQVRQERTVEFLSRTTQKLTDTLLNMASVSEVLPTLIHDALFIVDSKGKIAFANTVAQELLRSLNNGIEPVGLTVDHLTSSSRELRSVFNSDSDLEEIQVQGHTILLRSLPILDNAEVRGTIYLLRDITDLRKKERQLIAKSAVIREIHHRVKNNLQTIASLMRLQMRREQSQDTRMAFQESINRIRCIAQVYEMLSRDTLEVIELRECIYRIGQILKENMLLPEQPVEIEVDGDAVYISSDQATPTAIVVNEIIQNSLKYAFPSDSPGKISVVVENGEERVKILIRDNGRGFPPGFTLEANANLGLQITHVLVAESLGGNITMYNRNGAVVEIDFPKWGVGEGEITADSGGGRRVPNPHGSEGDADRTGTYGGWGSQKRGHGSGFSTTTASGSGNFGCQNGEGGWHQGRQTYHRSTLVRGGDADSLQ